MPQSLNRHFIRYLPSVATSFNWNIEDYMSRLSEKAGGDKNDWKKIENTMQVYKSINYKWNPIKKIITINK